MTTAKRADFLASSMLALAMLYDPFEFYSSFHSMHSQFQLHTLILQSCLYTSLRNLQTDWAGVTNSAALQPRLKMAEDWPDFGPGLLPTTLSQGIENKYVLELWDRLGDDKRTILEETIRELPLSRFVWFEKFLASMIFRPGESWVTPNWFRTLVASSSPALFRVCLRILTTPGREKGSIARRHRFDIPISHSAWWAGYHDWIVSVNMDDIYTNPYPANVDVGIDRVSDAGWLQLQQAVQELSPEIIRMIQDFMYESVFGPKDVVLPYVDPKDLRHFGALNRELYDRYHNLYYSENMWILADGPLDRIDECFTEMHGGTMLAIKNVTIRWTRADVDEAEWSELEPDCFIETQLDEGGPEGLNNIQALNDYIEARQRISIELKHIWAMKLMMLTALDLDLLVVDATDAYGPNGEYLGLNVHPLIPWFENGLPHYLEVWAPDEELASQIYDHLVPRQ